MFKTEKKQVNKENKIILNEANFCSSFNEAHFIFPLFGIVLLKNFQTSTFLINYLKNDLELKIKSNFCLRQSVYNS